MAAQFRGTKGLAARLLLKCSAFAISSLPVPFSPVIKTGESAVAYFSIMVARAFMACELPIIRYPP
jgi:hypothetical protein